MYDVYKYVLLLVVLHISFTYVLASESSAYMYPLSLPSPIHVLAILHVAHSYSLDGCHPRPVLLFLFWSLCELQQGLLLMVLPSSCVAAAAGPAFAESIGDSKRRSLSDSVTSPVVVCPSSARNCICSGQSYHYCRTQQTAQDKTGYM